MGVNMIKKYNLDREINFKIGIYDICEEIHFNYQLNRLVNWNGGDLDEVLNNCNQITNTEEWKSVLTRLGHKAESEGRIENAIAYYRMSEFYMQFDDPDALKYYTKARDLFYEYYSPLFDNENGNSIIKKEEVLFEDITLPVLHTKPENESRGIFLVHGGLDSYMEEFLIPMLYLREQGYEVYLFEGPGQGSVLRLKNKAFIHEWEKPVSAITQYYDLNDVTIIGISLGGYFAPRAAAFDKRISRVVGWSIFPSVWDNGRESKLAIKALHVFIGLKLGFIYDYILKSKSKKGVNEALAMRLMFHRFDVKGFNEFVKKIDNYSLKPIADKIDQDVLILGANNDIMINEKAIGTEINMLTQVKSLTYRLLTNKENAGNHCNCGNTKLALDTIINWVDELDKRTI